jgi:6-phosphogluconolactonase
VDVFPDPAVVARAAAEVFVEEAAAAIDATGRFAVALSGGSTPRGTYRLLAQPDYVERVDWGAVQVFWGDERCVPPQDPASDYLMAREAMLDHVPVREGHVHRIRGEAAPEEAALEYERLLRRAFGTQAGPPTPEPGARFDLVLLGMGEDGHTASLFPGTGTVGERERWVVAVTADVEPRRRVSLTVPVLNAAGRRLFVVTGVDKAPTLARVIEGAADPDALPSQAIEDADWFVDAAAASMLTG